MQKKKKITERGRGLGIGAVLGKVKTHCHRGRKGKKRFPAGKGATGEGGTATKKKGGARELLLWELSPSCMKLEELLDMPRERNQKAFFLFIGKVR